MNTHTQRESERESERERERKYPEILQNFFFLNIACIDTTSLIHINLHFVKTVRYKTIHKILLWTRLIEN